MGMNGQDVANDVAQAAQPTDEGTREDNEPPLFEVIIPSPIVGATEPAVHLKLWADGTVHGLRKLMQPGQPPAIVVNRVPNMIGTLTEPLQEYVDQLASLREALEATGAANESLAR